MSKYYTYSFVVAIAFNATCGETVAQSVESDRLRKEKQR